jgi:dienelactone hydrolase
VRAELCRAPGVARGPAVVVLHGCGGFGTLDHRLSERIAARGISTFYFDYFALTSHGRRGFCGAGPEIGSAFPVWQQTILDAAAALRREPAVDPRHVGAVGWSMGGFAALATASLPEHPFRALVLFSAGRGAQDVSTLPPTLVLSGGSGDAVPVAEAVALHRALLAAHVPTRLYVYAHGTHQWRGRQGRVGLRLTVAFLRRWL